MSLGRDNDFFMFFDRNDMGKNNLKSNICMSVKGMFNIREK